MVSALLSSSAQIVKGERRNQPSRLNVLCHASEGPEAAVTRRHALGLAAAGLAALSSVRSAEAAYGESAGIFKSKPTNTSGFIPYSGEGYALLLPSKWNPSREQEGPGVQLKYEDNGDSLNNVVIFSRKTDKSSIEQVGTPEAFLTDISKLLGEQVFTGSTRSEGGFQPNKVSAASLLGVEEAKDGKGKNYYKYNLLVRAADGNEGGRHQLITAAVSNGNLYICKVQIGDKRWFKGANKDAEGIHNSFVVA